jgi:predicted RNA-binding protein with RPS1 domain
MLSCSSAFPLAVLVEVQYRIQALPMFCDLLLYLQGSTLLDIEETCAASLIVDDTGAVTIYAPTQLQYQHAVAAVQEVEGRGLQAGHVYRVRVLRVVDFGAYVALPNGLPALLHISELSHSKIKEVREVVKEGDELDVLCKGRDAKGFVRLSRKDLLKGPEGGGSGLEAAEAAASAMAAAAAGGSSSSSSSDRAGGGSRRGGGHPRALTWQPPKQQQQQQQQQQDE